MELRDTILQGDALATLRALPDGIAQTCVTSPPYFGLRNYNIEGQIGLEATPEAYVARLVEVFREVARVLKPDGTLWLTIGDTYNQDSVVRAKANDRKGKVPITMRRRYLKHNGMKRKDLIGVPWMVATALRADGWYLRSEIIWAKQYLRPEGALVDRPDRSHETIFLLSRMFRGYRINYPALTTWGTVWTFDTAGGESNGASYPVELATRCILASTSLNDVVLDPFMGSGTTAVAARTNTRHYLGIDLNPRDVSHANRRIGTARQPHLWTA